MATIEDVIQFRDELKEKFGGTMEMPHFEHSMAQCIEAETPKEAVEIYNKKNKRSYYYGVVIGYYLNGKFKPTEEFIRATLSRIGIKWVTS